MNIELIRNEFKKGIPVGAGVHPSDDEIDRIITGFFETKRLTDARKYVYAQLDRIAGWHENMHVNWALSDSERIKSPEFIALEKRHALSRAWGPVDRALGIEREWVNINGCVRTDEEAAELAADKWCQLLFGFHMQDNGTGDDDVSFRACAIATLLSEDVKKGISEDVRARAKRNIKNYYLRYIKYWRGTTAERESCVSWMKAMYPGSEDYHFYEGSLCVDYGPSTLLHLILCHSGIKESDIMGICPWKTSISIRAVDNAVMWGSYNRVQEL